MDVKDPLLAPALSQQNALKEGEDDPSHIPLPDKWSSAPRPSGPLPVQASLELPHCLPTLSRCSGHCHSEAASLGVGSWSPWAKEALAGW